jgi:hypothetical protein
MLTAESENCWQRLIPRVASEQYPQLRAWMRVSASSLSSLSVPAIGR